MIRVVSITKNDLNWSFDGSAPSWRTKSKIKDWGTPVRVDPVPCYPHNKELVLKEVENIESVFSVGIHVTFHLSPWEDINRTNGWASQNWNYYGGKDGKTKLWETAIVFSGKRIPIHPAMTRYLVAHEYGHAVDYWISHCKDVSIEDLAEEYKELRSLPKSSTRYGPGRWDTNVGEVFANDFRILVAKRELEFWPHKFERPENLPAVKAFWKNAVKEFAQ